MRTKATNALEVAKRFIGTKEAPGTPSNPTILSMLRLDQSWPAGDDVPWCGAFCSYIAWLLALPRSRSLAARSWLIVGEPVYPVDAEPGFDVVVLKRGREPQPGPEVISGAPGHVGFFVGFDGDRVLVLGGNQGDTVSLQGFPRGSILGIRRLA